MVWRNLDWKRCQLISFRYRGGSDEGARLVLIDKFEKKGDATYLCGVDLRRLKPGQDKGYRRYCVNKIDGEIIPLLKPCQQLEKLLEFALTLNVRNDVSALNVNADDRVAVHTTSLG